MREIAAWRSQVPAGRPSPTTLGRRDRKTINGVSTQFLYDGLNPVQKIQNGAPSANLLTGLGIDEYSQRTDSAGARDYLTDILGSSLALTDSTGTIQTQLVRHLENTWVAEIEDALPDSVELQTRRRLADCVADGCGPRIPQASMMVSDNMD